MLSKITTKDGLSTWREKINKLVEVVESTAATANIAASGGVTGGVTSVAGKTGAVTLFPEDILGLGTAATASSGSFATYLQGLKADSALQETSGDLRYIRTINGSPADGAGNVNITSGAEIPELIDCGTFGFPPDGGTVTPGGPDLLDSGIF